MAGNDRHSLSFSNHFDPVVEPADHHGANRGLVGNVFSFGRSSFETALDGFGDRNSLRNGEADSRIQIQTAIRDLFRGGDTGAGRRYFDLYVGSQGIKVSGLLNDGRRIPVEGRIGLQRDAAFLSFFALEDRQEQGGRFRSHFLN